MGALSQFFSTSDNALDALRAILYYIVNDGWDEGKAVIITPGVEAAAYEAMKSDFESIANADSLNLAVFIYTTAQPGVRAAAAWPLGWDDGHTINVYIYPKEVFDEEKEIPEILNLLLHRNVLQ